MSARLDIVAQEPDRVPVKASLVIGAATLLTVIASVVIAAWLMQVFTAPGAQHSPAARESTAREIAGVEQTLIMSESTGLELARQQAEQLSDYGWVDRDHGFARIPIERAFDLMLERAR